MTKVKIPSGVEKGAQGQKRGTLILKGKLSGQKQRITWTMVGGWGASRQRDLHSVACTCFPLLLLFVLFVYKTAGLKCSSDLPACRGD